MILEVGYGWEEKQTDNVGYPRMNYHQENPLRESSFGAKYKRRNLDDCMLMPQIVLLNWKFILLAP